MSQQYIYKPTTVKGIQALYTNPEQPPGFTISSKLPESYDIQNDRYISDVLILPNDYTDIKITPSELVLSTSIGKAIDKLNENFAFLCSRCTLASNVLPSNFRGYYTNDGGSVGLPTFRQNSDNTLVVPPTAYNNAGALALDSQTPKLSATANGSDLNSLVSGAWVRDNSLISVDSAQFENFHYGFLASTTSITVVKMSNIPTDQTEPEFGIDGNPSGKNGWVVLDKITNVEQLPSDKNKLYFNNITKVKKDGKKYIYVLDSGNDRPGVNAVSTSSRRGVLYKYDVTGYIDNNVEYTTQERKLKLVNRLGDLNTVTNVSDVVDPVVFTVDQEQNVIIYDEHDYTFKIFDRYNNFIKKYPKRNIFFRGAAGSEKTYIGAQDLHYDSKSEQYYLLSKIGILIIMDKNFKVLKQLVIPKGTSNQTTKFSPYDEEHPYYQVNQTGDPQNEIFLSLLFSENENNTFFIVTDRRIIKRFKSRDENNVAVFNLLDVNIGLNVQPTGTLGWRAKLQFVDLVQEANIVTKQFTNSDGEIAYVIDDNRSYTYDQFYVYTDFINLRQSANLKRDIYTNNKFILNIQERETLKSCLTQNSFPVYNINETNSISIREYTSDIVYNKLFYKMISNHIELIKRISYRLTANYTSTGELVFNKIKYLLEHEHRGIQITTDDMNVYVGINEYISPGTINRSLKYIHDIQSKILNVLQTHKNNTWPIDNLNVAVEPFLYTNGDEFVDIDGQRYEGYYYIREQSGGDIYVTGRKDTDGLQLDDGSPSTNRYLTQIETGQ